MWSPKSIRWSLEFIRHRKLQRFYDEHFGFEKNTMFYDASKENKTKKKNKPNTVPFKSFSLPIIFIYVLLFSAKTEYWIWKPIEILAEIQTWWVHLKVFNHLFFLLSGWRQEIMEINGFHVWYETFARQCKLINYWFQRWISEIENISNFSLSNDGTLWMFHFFLFCPKKNFWLWIENGSNWLLFFLISECFAIFDDIISVSFL